MAKLFHPAISCGLRSSGGSNPPVEDPPTALKTKVNGTLSGAAGWTTADCTPFCFSGVGTAA